MAGLLGISETESGVSETLTHGKERVQQRGALFCSLWLPNITPNP